MKHTLYTLVFVFYAISAFSQGYSGLIARWPFTGNANDVSGNGLNGIVYGATLTTGYTGVANTAYQFNGTSDYISVPYNSLMNSKLHSICALVKPLGFNSGPCQGNYILCRGHENFSDFYGFEYCDNVYDNDCSIYSPCCDLFYGGTGNPIATGPSSEMRYTPYTAPNTWYCVVLTYDGDSTRIYVNGILKSTLYYSATYLNSSDSITIGKSIYGPPFDYFINGVMDEVRLYDRVLSPTEVTMFCDSAEANYTIPSISCDSISLPDTIKACKYSTIILPAKLFGTDSPASTNWIPSTGLSNANILNPTLTVGTSGWYYLTVGSLLPGNLVVNGDFSAGNSGFTSAYPYVVSGYGALTPAGLYTITTDPSLDNPYTTTSFGDHTTGTGNMMAMNGASTPIDVWCETITVSPNTYYDFSAWFANWSADTSNNFPILQFEINGTLISSVLSFPHTDGIWTQFFTTWYSGSNTSATICINDQQTAATGNDFAIDDISFQQLCTTKDSVYIDIAVNDTIYNHENISGCASSGPIALNAPSGYSSYAWNNGNTTPSVSVSSSGTWWVDAFNGSCSMLVDTFHTTFISSPVVSLGNDTTICSGKSFTLKSMQPIDAQYLWSNGSNASSIVVTNSGIYSLTVTINGCITSDSINVSQISAPVVHLGADTTVCNGANFSLQVNSDNAKYLWSDGSSGQNIDITKTGTYWATASNMCGSSSDTVNITYELCDIWFPSAFTPNGDSRNDIIRVVGSLSQYKDFSLSIYNRFGQRVFYTQNIYEGWDGVFNGVKQDIGTYFYMIFYSLEGKKSLMKGDFELIR